MDWGTVPIVRHLDDFEQHLTGKGYTANHVYTRKHYCSLAFKACRIKTLADISRSKIEAWLKDLKDSGASERTAEQGASARTVNMAKASIVQFVRWCVREGRITNNPLEHIEGYSETTDRRHIRRALTPAELAGLIEAARTRPLEEKKVNQGGRLSPGEPEPEIRPIRQAEPSPATVAKLTALGETRAMAYLLMAGTGLRYGELRRLRLCDLVLDGNNPRVELPGQSTKNRKEAGIPLRSDLAAELASHITRRFETSQRTAQEAKRPIELRIDPKGPLFLGLPGKMIKVFDRDLKAAGIPKHDHRGRVADVHSLRVTFISGLAAAGVPLATAQVLARHSDPRLTSNVYTDPAMLDLRGAVEAIPVHRQEENRLAAQVGENSPEKRPPIRPLSGRISVHFPASSCNELEQPASTATEHRTDSKLAGNGRFSRKNRTNAVVGCDSEEWRARQDSNLWPLAPEASERDSQTTAPQALTENQISTSPPASPELSPTAPSEMPPSDIPGAAPNPLLETLASVLRGLAPEDRAALLKALEPRDES